MSLRFKLLVALYAAVGLVWLIHASWQMRRFERAVVAAEVRATTELASGLRMYLRHLASHHQVRGALNDELGCCQRDVMVLDRSFRVVAASDPSRVGRTWTEPGIDSVMRGERDIAYNDHEHDGHRVIDVTLAVAGEDGKPAYLIHAARSQDELQAELWRQRRDHVILLVSAFVLMTVLVTAFTHRMILAPLGRVQRRIRSSPWGTAVAGEEVRDLHALERAVRAMLERIEADREALQQAVDEKSGLLEEVHRMKDGLEVEVDRVRRDLQSAEKSLLRAERHAALAQLSGALAHELRNPLHIVRGLAETAGRKKPEVAAYTDDIKSEVDRIDQLIRELLQFTRPLDIDVRPLSVDNLIEAACDRVERARQDRGRPTCPVSVATESVDLRGDLVLLGQAIENLLENACDAAGPDGNVVVRQVDDGTWCTITIQDTGPGMTSEDMDRAFEPFFTRKPAGTGLGLSVAQRIIEMHGGELTIANHADGGLIATVRLPSHEGTTDEQDPGRR